MIYPTIALGNFIKVKMFSETFENDVRQHLATLAEDDHFANGEALYWLGVFFAVKFTDQTKNPLDLEESIATIINSLQALNKLNREELLEAKTAQLYMRAVRSFRSAHFYILRNQRDDLAKRFNSKQILFKDRYKEVVQHIAENAELELVIYLSVSDLTWGLTKIFLGLTFEGMKALSEEWCLSLIDQVTIDANFVRAHKETCTGALRRNVDEQLAEYDFFRRLLA